MALTIDDLLNSLKNPNKPKEGATLENNRSTWERIGKRDSFSELGLEGGELEKFLQDWINDNPYSNI